MVSACIVSGVDSFMWVFDSQIDDKNLSWPVMSEEWVLRETK